MPDRTISVLSASAGALVLLYLALVVTTVTFAAMRTDLAASVRDTESRIASLETRYYAQVGVLSATDPASMDLHKPVAVHYATLQSAPTLSLR